MAGLDVSFNKLSEVGRGDWFLFVSGNVGGGGYRGVMARREPALSASRAKEYMQCPLKFRYSVVDAIPQPPTEATIKGTVVHHVLERLYDAPQDQRTPEVAQELLPGAWETTLEHQPDAHALFEEPSVKQSAQADTVELVDNYFRIERPQFLNPKAREQFVDARLSGGVLLRGIVDRIDEAPNGALRVVDYKTGKAPSPRFVDDALFQMRFYALLLREVWRVPARLQLLYLRSTQVLTLDPEERDIEAFEEEIGGLWNRIKTDAQRERFTPRKSALCPWCPFQEMCPIFGGKVPPPPEDGLARLLAIEQVDQAN